MKIFFLLIICASNSWAVNAKYKSTNDGLGGNILPHAVLYSTYSQQMTDGVNAQYLELNSSYHKYKFTQINRSTWSVEEPGMYEFCFSGIADLASTPAAKIEFWLRINGVDVPDSNTVIGVPNAVTEMTAAACFLEALNANDNFNIRPIARTPICFGYTLRQGQAPQGQPRRL